VVIATQGLAFLLFAGDVSKWVWILSPGVQSSPDGKWISYDSEEEVKTRSEGSIWEADFEEISNKLGMY